MEEIVSRAICEMVAFYDRTSTVRLHDINHFMKVWGFARTIGLGEGLDDKTQLIVELAAVAHDIACPLCREKYGNTDGKKQEEEGAPLARKFYQNYPLSEEQRRRICYLVGHHHTYNQADGIDYQIMLEADFLVNADESRLSREAIRKFRDHVFRTGTGKRLLESMYHPDREAQL
jgi:hypothetical protein